MEAAKKNLLIIECTPHLDWYRVFDGVDHITVHQAEWDDISVVSYSDSGCVVSCRAAKKPLPNSNQINDRTFSCHFVLTRSVSKGTWGQDSSNKLFALIHSGVPGVNSLFSNFCFNEKAVVFAELRKIQRQLGRDVFPLIPQTLYPSYREMIISPDFPCVGKVGSAHAGKGKIKINDGEVFEDFASLAALQPYYITTEPYIKWDWDGRIQRIGPHLRAFKRVTSTWKGNTGRGAVLEDIPITPLFQQWADHCATLFGGIEIFGLDFVHEPSTGKFWILELNEGAIGLVHKHAQEDMMQMRDVVIAKMAAITAGPPKEEEPNRSAQDVAILREQVRRLILEKKDLQELLQSGGGGGGGARSPSPIGRGLFSSKSPSEAPSTKK